MLAFFHIGKDWSLQRKHKTVFQPDEEVGGAYSLSQMVWGPLGSVFFMQILLSSL